MLGAWHAHGNPHWMSVFFLFVALTEIRSMQVQIQQSYNNLALKCAELYILCRYVKFQLQKNISSFFYIFETNYC